MALALTLIGVVGSWRLGAQQRQSLAEHPADSALRAWVVGGWVAEARHQPLKTAFGHVHDRDLYLTGLRFIRTIHEGHRFSFDYTGDLLPYVEATANRQYRIQKIICPLGAICVVPPSGGILVASQYTANGVGFTPFGLRPGLILTRRIRFVTGLSVGGVYFNRKVPDSGETRFNFTVDGNVGFLVRTGIGGFSAGGRLYHISNANTGEVNPSINSRMLYVGYER